MQKRKFRFNTIKKGVRLCVSTLFFRHRAKRRTKDKKIDDHRELVRWY